MTIDPDPNIEPEEPELYLNEEELERRRNPLASTSRRSSRKDSTISRTSDGSGSSSEGDEGVCSEIGYLCSKNLPYF